MIAPIFFSLDACTGLYATSINTFQKPLSERLNGEFNLLDGPVTFWLSGSARSWPELMGPGNGALIATSAAAQAITRSSLTAYELFPARIEFNSSCALNEKPKPDYLWLKPLGEITIDESRLEEKIMKGKLPRKIPLRETWNGGDFIRVTGKKWTTLFCTRAFIKLARDQKWKHLHFAPMDLMNGLAVEYGANQAKGGAKQSIDYLGKQWPPLWYPPGVDGDPSNLEEVESI